MDDVDITDDHVRSARRAYYGAISYVDDKIGRLVEVLRQTGQLDNTVVIVTSDHGDMQGERGLWYKMSFYEGSVRVPLVVSAPSRFAPRRVAAPVSTMDLLPTLVGLGCDRDATPVVGDLDGSSLLPLCAGADDDRDLLVAEYLAEGAVAPIVMLRRGAIKLVHCPVEPDQLYDLEADPLERVNLVHDPAYADVLAELRAVAQSRWDLARLDEEVRLSQQRRLIVAGALGDGSEGAWDYAPPYDAARRYIRNHMDLGELETRARFPRVAVASEVAGNPEP
jgi:choline-sulfatase